MSLQNAAKMISHTILRMQAHEGSAGAGNAGVVVVGGGMLDGIVKA
jgi:hypothetical protein